MDESDREARPPAPDDDRTGNDLPARAPHVPTTLHAAESDELFGSPMPPRLTARRLVLRGTGHRHDGRAGAGTSAPGALQRIS